MSAVAAAMHEHPLVAGHAVIVDGWAVVRRGLQDVLESAGFTTDAVAASANERLAALTDGAAGVLVLGSVADQSQRDAVGRAVGRGWRVLVLLSVAEQSDVIELYRAGALAVVSRTATDRELRAALRHVLAGDVYVAPTLDGAVLPPTNWLV